MFNVRCCKGDADWSHCGEAVSADREFQPVPDQPIDIVQVDTVNRKSGDEYQHGEKESRRTEVVLAAP
jgi:hypothetical protein